MGNDATQPHVRLSDRRTTKWPTKEPLALRLIREKLATGSHEKAFCRNVCLYYDAVVQFVTMRGEHCEIEEGDFETFVYLDRKTLKPCREFLVKIGLLRVTRAPSPEGGGREDIFFELLDAPFANYEKQGTQPGGDPGNQDRAAGYQGGTRHNADGQQTTDLPNTPPGTKAVLKEVSEVASSEVSTTVDTSSEVGFARTALPSVAGSSEPDSFPRNGNDDDYPNPERWHLERFGPRSLRPWTREEIAAWHAGHADVPPPGASFTQSVATAVATTPGFDPWVSKVKGGYNAFYSRLHRFIHYPMSGHAVLYRHWMDGALSFQKMPIPASGESSLDYWIAALRNQATTMAGRRAEAEHQRVKDGRYLDDLSDEEIITVEELEAVRAVEEGVA